LKWARALEDFAASDEKGETAIQTARMIAFTWLYLGL
jgi:hypothetical protein